MKKYIIILCMFLCLCGCGKKTELESGTYKTQSIFDSTFNFNENGS